MEIQKLTKLSGMLAEIESIKIFVEGMKVENIQRSIQDESPAYGEEQFSKLAVRVGEISSELKILEW